MVMFPLCLCAAILGFKTHPAPAAAVLTIVYSCYYHNTPTTYNTQHVILLETLDSEAACSILPAPELGYILD